MKTVKSYLKRLLVPVLPLMLLTNACMKPLSEGVTDEKAGLNGSFEIASEKMPVNWLLYTNTTTGQGDFSILLDTTIKQEGKQSLMFHVTACSPEGGRYSPGFTREIPVKAGDTYRIGFWTKNNNSRYRFNISGVNAHHKSDGPVLKDQSSTNDWLYQECVYQIPEQMDHLRLEFNVLSKGDCWIDNIHIEKQ